MYTFQIETIHDKNMVLENKMVGGGGKQFKVYRASDINKLFDDKLTKDDYKKSISAFTDTLTIDQLFDYYFCYIIYDTFDKDLCISFFFTNALQASIEKKLLIIQDIQDIQKKNTNGEFKVIQYDELSDDRSLFCRYILDLFDIKSGQQTVQLPYANFLDENVIVLSEGQYLNHIDLIYSKYSLIIQNYKDHIDDIETYDNAEFVAKYNKEKQEIIEKNKAYVDKKEIPDEKYIVLHLLFLLKTYIDPNRGVTEAQPKSYLLLIDEKYAKLEVIKDQNLFYNTNKMFIRNKAEFLKAIKLKIKDDVKFQTLSAHNGIEKLLNIYYAYIPHESSKDDKAIHEVFSNLCMKISDFFITNKNIYNLLLFNDTIFFKMIKDDLILTLYDLEKQFEHKFGFVRTEEDSIHFDIQQGFTLDTEYIKQMMLYRYKQLEQTIRRLYLDQYDISAKNITVTGTITGTGTTSYSAPKFYEVIQMRKKKLNICFVLWTVKQHRYIKRIINVIDFYRVGRLIEYYAAAYDFNTPRKGTSESTDKCIGIITSIENLFFTIKRLSVKKDLLIYTNKNDENDKNISIDSIRETEYILCDKVISSAVTNTPVNATQQRVNAWSCDNEVKIKYHDMDLFDLTYDIEIYTILLSDIKLDLSIENPPKCLVLRTAFYVDHKHREKKYQQLAQVLSPSGTSVRDEDFDDIINLVETYVSIYSIKDGKTLYVEQCFSICDTKLIQIENMIEEASMKIYDETKTSYCFLIEKVLDEKIVQTTKHPYDTLFFIDEDKKQQILKVTNSSS